jgi:hypothetical protein
MDTGIANVLSTTLGTWKTDIFSQYGVVLALSLPIALGLALAMKTLKWFRGQSGF